MGFLELCIAIIMVAVGTRYGYFVPGMHILEFLFYVLALFS